jgi:TPR repeat protein
LAEWYREGDHLPRDFAAAREYYRRSPSRLDRGMRRYLALWVLGIGGERDWAAGPELLELRVQSTPLRRRSWRWFGRWR